MKSGRLARFRLIALLLPIALAGCVSLAGSQPRFIDARQSQELLKNYRMDTALATFAAEDNRLRHGWTRKQYRDFVVPLYLAAIEANYADFRSRVSSERRELGLGLDLVVGGFTTYAAVASRAIVNDLSAAAAGFAGARGAIDRNVYFDRALPGLLAAMDAQRARIKTQITENLRRSDTEYPLSAAFADLSNLEMAGSLDRAIEDITARAAQDRQEAERLYSNAVHACESTEDLRANRLRIMNWALAGGRTLAELRGLAGLMNVSQDGAEDAVVDRIENALATNYCSNGGLETLINNAKQTQWGSGI